MMACLNESVSEDGSPRRQPEMKYIHPTDNTRNTMTITTPTTPNSRTTYPLCSSDNNMKSSAIIPCKNPVIDLNVLAHYIEQKTIPSSSSSLSSSSKPSKRHTHKRQTPSIDLTTCKRKRSLYGDSSQTQVYI